MKIYDVSAYERSDKKVGGARKKQWIMDPSGALWLYKVPRSGKSEAVAEVMAYRLAHLLGVRHAITALATDNGVIGSVSRNILTERDNMELIEMKSLIKGANGWSSPSVARGNTLYKKYSKVYAVNLIAESIETMFSVDNGLMPFFYQTMLFDALIVNSDRHHGNWGVLRGIEYPDLVEICPLYDSGSGFFSTVPDEKLARILKEGQLKNRVQGAQSMVRKDEDSQNTSFGSLVAFLAKFDASRKIYEQFCVTLRRILTDSDISTFVSEFASELSPLRVKFLNELIMTSRDYILSHSSVASEKRNSSTDRLNTRQSFILKHNNVNITARQYADRFKISMESAHAELLFLCNLKKLRRCKVGGVWHYGNSGKY